MEFTVKGGNKNASIVLEQKQEGDILHVNVKMDLETPAIPEKVCISWKFKSIDCCSVWSPTLGLDRYLSFTFAKRKTSSRLASGMPLHQLVSMGGQNRLNIVIADCLTPASIATGICEEDACLDCELELFTIPTSPISTYTTEIRLDMRDIPYYDSIYDAVDWLENVHGYKPACVPETAKLPMNSLWYSYHQQLDPESIVKECRWSKPLGMDTVLIDDGWQTEGDDRSYARCGDWEAKESKVGNMKELVDRIHAEGMKVIVWFGVPLVGIESKAYEEFKDMLIDEELGFNKEIRCFDPRYKKVRDHLIGVYTRAVTEWGIDGLKLDFIDIFSLKGKSLEADPRRDYSSLEEAIDVLLTDVREALTAINPEVMIEFRQTYIGPAVRKYGNMLRVADCPNDTLLNRTGIVNLRFTSGKTAVHSDMIMWHPEDKVESAALQFVNILYGVPQISMRADSLPEDHYKMLKYYISFWREWREVLLDGKLTANNPEALYSQVCSSLNDKAVVTVYTDPRVEVRTGETVIVNGADRGPVIIKNAAGKKYRTVNCMGEELARGSIDAALEEIEVPMAGMIFVE